MKRNWPILFLFALLLFQLYVISWNKNQTMTLATEKTSITPTPTSLCDTTFVYPSSIVKEQHATDAFLESNSNPLVIREWYKHAFAINDFKLTSDVLTSNNTTNTYLLAAEKVAHQATVIIGKGASETTTTIFIRELCN